MVDNNHIFQAFHAFSSPTFIPNLNSHPDDNTDDNEDDNEDDDEAVMTDDRG